MAAATDIPPEIASINVDMQMLAFIIAGLAIIIVSVWAVFKIRQGDKDEFERKLQAMADAVRLEIKENHDADQKTKDELHKRANKFDDKLQENTVEFYKTIIKVMLGKNDE